MAVIRQIDEAFWLFGDIVEPMATRTWHGPAPRMSSRDGDGSYGRIHPGNLPIGQYAGVGIRMPAFTWPAEGIRIRAQVRFPGEWTQGDHTAGGYFAIVAQTPDWPFILDWNVAGVNNPTTFWQYRSAPDPAHPGWELLDFVAVPDANVVAEAAAGNLWVCALTTPNAPDGFDVSWIQVGEAETAHPLQWRARTDGLGSSGVQPARSASTFRATGRARGMI